MIMRSDLPRPAASPPQLHVLVRLSKKTTLNPPGSLGFSSKILDPRKEKKNLEKEAVKRSLVEDYLTSNSLDVQRTARFQFSRLWQLDLVGIVFGEKALLHLSRKVKMRPRWLSCLGKKCALAWLLLGLTENKDLFIRSVYHPHNVSLLSKLIRLCLVCYAYVFASTPLFLKERIASILMFLFLFFCLLHQLTVSYGSFFPPTPTSSFGVSGYLVGKLWHTGFIILLI